MVLEVINHPDLYSQVLRHLPLKEVVRFACVCRAAEEASREGAPLWKEVYDAFVARRKEQSRQLEAAHRERRLYKGALRLGLVALREKTRPSIGRVRFQRLVREIAQDFMTDLTWQASAVDALQLAAENCMTNLFTDALEAAAVDRPSARGPDGVEGGVESTDSGNSSSAGPSAGPSSLSSCL